MARPSVGVVVLNWNNLTDTLECLGSVAKSSYRDTWVVLVDNGSAEDPSLAVGAQYPEVLVLRQPQNLGYSGGNNAGVVWLLEKGVDYVLLLNNDAIVEAGMIEELVYVAERNPDAGFVTPRIFIHGTNEVYWGGGTVDWLTGETSHDGSVLVGRDGALESGWSNGCAPLIRSETIHEIGLMDSDLFLYCEDVDWSARASKAGWQHLVAVNATCWHKVSRSSIGVAIRYYLTRNRYRVLVRHSPKYKSFLGVPRYGIRVLVDYHRAKAEVAGRRAVLQGALDLVQGRWGERQHRSSVFLAVCDVIIYPLAIVNSVVLRALNLVRRLKPLLPAIERRPIGASESDRRSHDARQQ